jgi:hypothetical protein
MRRGCHDDTGKIVAEYACLKSCVNVSHLLPGHHVIARTLRCAEARSMPEAASRSCAVGAERRGIDGAEHSAMLIDVMAGWALVVDTVVPLSLRHMLTSSTDMVSTQTTRGIEARTEVEAPLDSRARV